VSQCDNYEVPWILMDGVILSSRSFMILSMVFMVMGVAIAFIGGEWNNVAEKMERKTRKWLYRIEVNKVILNK